MFEDAVTKLEASRALIGTVPQGAATIAWSSAHGLGSLIAQGIIGDGPAIRRAQADVIQGIHRALGLDDRPGSIRG